MVWVTVYMDCFDNWLAVSEMLTCQWEQWECHNLCWVESSQEHSLYLYLYSVTFASLSTGGIKTSAGWNQVKLLFLMIIVTSLFLFFSFLKPFSLKKIQCATIPKKRFNVEVGKENQLMTWWTHQHAIHSEALERLEIRSFPNFWCFSRNFSLNINVNSTFRKVQRLAAEYMSLY